MTESWRSILERAAENLSIELDQMVTPGLRPAQAAAFGSHRLSPQLSFAESREMLARELNAFSTQSRDWPVKMQTAAVAPISHPVTVRMPAQTERPNTSNSRKAAAAWSNVMATLMSGAITTGLAGYLFLVQGDFGKEGLLALSANLGLSAMSEQGHPAEPTAAANVPPSLNRSTEDSLMERASYQLNHGDAESGRAVYEVLAHHGSARGAFALAETYDPAPLAQHTNWGLQSNMQLAREWYKKASELGSLPAYERLKTLDSSGSRKQRSAQLTRSN